MKTFLLTLSILGLALFSFNFFLKYTPFSYSVSPVIYDKDIGMWHKKNYSSYAIQPCYKNLYTFDTAGLPINIYPYDVTKKDIILLGDSFIEAIMVKNKNIIHNSLAQEYNNKYNFLNYGLSATNTIQQYHILKKKVNLNNVKTVLHFINLEDDLNGILNKNKGRLSRAKVYMEFQSLTEYVTIPPRKETYIDKITDKLGEFQIYFFLKKSLYYLKNKILIPNQTFKTSIDNHLEPKDLTKNWLYLNASIFQVKQLLNKYQINYKLIIVSKKEKNYKRISEFLNKKNINFILLNSLALQMKMPLETFSCDEHWNNNTHQNIAKILKENNFIQ